PGPGVDAGGGRGHPRGGGLDLAGLTVRVLVVNAGSSSVKLRLLDEGDEPVGSEDVPAVAGRADPGAVDAALDALDALGRPDAVGHRVVHGGPHRTGPALLDDG